MKSNVWKMYAINLVKNTMFFSPVSVLFFLDWAKIDYTQLFVLEASFSFWMFAMEIPTGVIADRYGRKISLALGGLVSAISFAIFGLVNNYAVFFLAEFICAIGFTLLSGADRALVYDTLIALNRKENATVVFARYESFGVAGIIVGLIFGSIIAGMKSIGYPASLPLTFSATAASLFLVFLLSFTLHEPKRKKTGDRPIRQGIDGFKYIFRNVRLRGFAFNYTFISAACFFMFWLYQPLLKIGGIPVSYNGIVGAAFNLFGIVLMMNVIRIEKLIGINRVLFLSALLPGLIYAGLFFSMNVVYGLMAILFIIGLRQMRSPLLSDFINRHIESRNRATVLSGISMLERIVIMIMYPVIGLLADHALSAAFIFLGLSTVIFAFISKVEVDTMPEGGTA